MEDNKTIFLKLCRDNIQRDGIEPLLKWLETETDFFSAPASSKYHEPYVGGLCEHSLMVFYKLLNSESIKNDKYPYSLETITIVALFHDLCKTNYYKMDFRNVKNETTGQWEKKSYYTADDKLGLGHGEASLFLLTQFLKLTVDEARAIRWHMGAFDSSAVGSNSKSFNSAWQQTPLAVELHIADLRATYEK